jgi:parallel beta-helix repeat protein
MRSFLTAVTAVVSFGVALAAQIPGRNVNMVSGTTWPKGDPYLQRQNEPSIAASTRNPLHLVAGANDYRTVDLPGLPDGGETGDAWLGLFKSFDGGQRWVSDLVPGYPQDRSAAGLASPIKGYQAAADPVVRAGTNGLIYYTGLAFDRGDNGRSAIFMARFIDNNNKENGDPIAYLGTSLVAADSGTRFFDKPWLAVDIPRGVATCTISTPDSQGRTTTQTLPAGPAYVAFTAFSGSGTSLTSSIMFSYSANCGVTWSTPVSLSGTTGLHQGPTISIDPKTGNVYVAWRRFADGTNPDAIMVAQSINFGQKFTTAKEARRVANGQANGLNLNKVLEHRKPKAEDEVDAISQFDQGTSAADLSFRTNAYPAMTFDGDGRMYLAWTERGSATLRPDAATGDARVMVATSTDGSTWTAARAVAEYGQLGHQLMPSLTYAGGRLLLVYYDLVEDVSQTFGRYVDDKSAIVSGKRHTLDIRASLGTPGATPMFGPSVKVSDYLFGVRPNGTNVEQLQFNPPNLPMFAQGTVPFMGDYIDLTPAPAFVPAGSGKWVYNTSPAAVPVFHAVWTDNRDVRQPANNDWTSYTPPTLNNGLVASTFDPTKPQPVCNAGSTGSRNQNIYTARITGGLIVGAPGNAKPLSTSLQRAFVVFAQNTTGVIRSFRLTIANQPAGGRASFEQFPLPPYTAQSPAPLTVLDVTTPPYSMASRTVYVTSSDPHAQVTVAVSEIAQPGAPSPLSGGLTSSVVLNPDIANPDIANPDIANPDIANPDIANAEVANPDIANPDIANPDIANPDIANPDIANPDIANLTVANPDIANPDIANPDIANPDIANPDIANPDIANPDIANGAISDVTWTITNDGNTTSAFNVNLFLAQATIPNGTAVQLVLHKVYSTPATVGCELGTEARNVLVANITNPVFVTPNTPGLPDPNRPDGNNATLWLAPGESAKITLRIKDADTSNNVLYNGHLIDPAFIPDQTVTPGIIPQAVPTLDARNGVTEPPVVTPPNLSTMQFLQQPASVALGETMPLVTVLVRDATGALLPSAPVTLTLKQNPTTSTLLGTTTALTNAAGVAAFGDLRVPEIGTGYQLVATVTAPAGVAPAPATSAPFDVTGLVVTNANDSGKGSLRQAMLNANAHTGADTITFAIPAGAPAVIAPQTLLPEMTEPVTIDATTEPGYAGTPLVTLSGNALGAGGQALRLHGGGSTVRGLTIVSFNTANGYAIEVRGAGNVIADNLLGTDAAGTAGLGNRFGILADQVTGSTFERNVVSGNAADGILLVGGSGNTIQDNRIGTAPDGSAAIANSGNGITSYSGTSQLTISGNEIAGNSGWGIDLQASCEITCANPATGVTIAGNRIGIRAGGAAAGNGSGGVHAAGAEALQIGVAGNGNVISANGGPGIVIAARSVVLPIIRANRIGTTPTGTEALSNTSEGIVLGGAAIVGGAGTGEGNLISGNGNASARAGAGIVVLPSAAGSQILGNTIGLSATGSPLGNGYSGITALEVNGLTIGGTAPGSGNVIGGNASVGIAIYPQSCADCLPSNISIEGNTIGGPGVPANGLWGIEAGGDGISIGGLAAGAGNTIQSSGNDAGGGIHVLDYPDRPHSRVTILSNAISSSAGLGIDLDPTGISGGSDAGDADTGPNGLQNFPDLSLARNDRAQSTTQVDYSLAASAPGAKYLLQFFASASCNASGNGAGDRLVSTIEVAATADYQVSGTLVMPELLAAGTVVTATATDSAGNTSEFSNCATVQDETNVFQWTVASGGNGHFYRYVTTPLTWDQAKAAAESTSYRGVQGHLVTITSAGENAFVGSLKTLMGLGDMRGWIGLFDRSGTGAWTWVTNEDFSYTNWDTGEPNSIGTELAVEFYGSTNSWNNNVGNANPFIQGYIIEYDVTVIG